jgi:hypothetical protein
MDRMPRKFDRAMRRFQLETPGGDLVPDREIEIQNRLNKGVFVGSKRRSVPWIRGDWSGQFSEASTANPRP